MHLLTDAQTINDLNIFGKRGGAGIFELYNCTRTRGGELILKELFKNPLSNRKEICRRSSLIRVFALNQIAFPFSAAMLDSVEKYVGIENDFSKKIAGVSPLGEKEIQNGVMAVIEVMKTAREFIDGLSSQEFAASFEERNDMDRLLADPAFEPIFKEALKSRLSYAAVTAYDNLIRLREFNKIKSLLKHIYYLDVYLSAAKLATERKFIFPNVLDDELTMLDIEGVYHPELKEPVENNLVMDRNSNVLFLTGANMAGKSTFLRSVCTAVYIAHMGFPVAAKSMNFSVMDGIYTTINLPDDLGTGASHFYNEVLRLKKVAVELAANKSLFVVFDELFRGTNVKDANDSTVAVARLFAQNNNSIFIISSHIAEAGELLQGESGVSFKYLPTRMNGHLPQYSYKLEDGITADRHGMIIIRNEGILEILRDGKK